MITVIDAGILMNTLTIPQIDGNIIISQSGYNEIISQQARQVLNLLEANRKLVKMEVPQKWIKDAKKGADEIGQNKLSLPDLEVLALALMLRNTDEIRILSDDFGLRNVAHHLKIESMSITVEGGSQKRVYGYTCLGCGSVFMRTITECDVCGHTKFKRFRK